MTYTLKVWVHDRLTGDGREETFICDNCLDREMACQVVEGMGSARYDHRILSVDEADCELPALVTD
jgi:hypothetical protein